MSSPDIDPAAEGRSRTRKRALASVAVVVVLGVLIWGSYWLLHGRYFESTDDGYVSGDIVAVTAREAGTVLALHADNTQWVKRGQLLVALDPASANIGMLASEADLAHSVRQVRALYSKTDTLSAQIAQSRVQLSQAATDYARRSAASGDGAVSGEELAHARDALASARASLAATQSQRRETLAQTEGTTITTDPDVLAAEARLRAAALTLSHTQLVAPVDGEIAQRTVQLGEQIAAGTPLMAVVPLNDVWVDANFKEVQLKRMRVGQPVTISTDIYGSSVTYHGRVAGLAAGSGGAFALLPPQNASGNWIKIVQRVPVRIVLDPGELRDHPLRVGLSVSATVDVRDQSGPLVASRVRNNQPAAETSDEGGARVEALIAQIIAGNSGRPANP